MSLITIILALVVLGVVLWLVSLIPMDGTIKKIITVVAVIAAVVWLLKAFGLWYYLGKVHF